MADNTKLEKKATESRKIVCKRPADKNSGATILRLPEEGTKKKPFDIYEGQTLIVGREVSEETAKRLLDMKSWKFEEVK